jgi:hypothetical protein
MVHWLFAVGILFVGLCLFAEALAGREVWHMRHWRKYLWPALTFVLGLFLWPVMAFFTNSAIHMYAHGSWADGLMLAGAAELGLVHGRLHSPLWRLTWPLAFRPRSAAFQAAFAAVIVVVSIQLFADRDVAPIFGHLSPLAGQQHR